LAKKSLSRDLAARNLAHR